MNMISRHGRCDTNRLREFLDSPPAEDGGSCDIAEHLEHCEKCRSELEAMAGGRWWSEVRPFVRPEGDEEAAARTQAPVAPRADDAELNFLSPPDQPGCLGRFGPYQVLDVLGKGGMGVVLKALDPALRRIVAIKVLSPMLATSGPSRARFTREAQAAAAVVHNHVVAIFHIDTDKTSGLPYLVMPCIVGRSLQERIDRDGSLDVAAVLRIGLQAASGLAAAHSQGIVHRDVKPANILLENGVERVVLTDFGLARAVDDASLTQSGVIAGTPQYMSPEQARGEVADHRSDLFSLGSVLYAMCAGHPPFRANSALAVLRRVSDEHARSIRELNPAVPESLAAVIDRLHAKDPAERYQTAEEVAAELEQILADSQKPGRRAAAPPLPAPKAMPRRPWHPALVAGVIVVALAGLFALASGKDRLRERMSLFSFSQADDASGGRSDGRESAAPDGSVPARHSNPGQHTHGNRDADGKAVACCDADGKANCDEDDDEDTVIPRIRIPLGPIEVPFGPLVRFGREYGVAVQVVLGTPGDTVTGSGKSETRSFPLKDFTTVEVRGPYFVELSQGKEFQVAITADDNVFDHLQVEKDGKKLLLSFKGKNLRLNLDGEHPLKASVTLPDLEGLHLNGAVHASVGEFTTTRPVRLQISGASQLKGSLKGAEVTVDANGASTVKLEGSGKNLRLKSNGASHLKMADFTATGDRLIVDAGGTSFVALKGSVKAGVLKVVGASHVDLRGTNLAAADVTVEGASHASVSVSEKLDYSVTGASHLDYYGDPTIGKASKHGASHVSQKK
jgi:serine/threonine protein kinase